MKLKFDHTDARLACDAWGCNCGPAALAAATAKTLDDVRPFLGAFESRGYMNITMMREAIDRVGWRIVRSGTSWPVEGVGLVRIQWGGPWIIGGKPARWASTATHWVATYRHTSSHLYVFDINGGLMCVEHWELEVVPKILESIRRADGTWSISHGWQIIEKPPALTPQEIAWAYCENEMHAGYPCRTEGCPHCGGPEA